MSQYVSLESKRAHILFLINLQIFEILLPGIIQAYVGGLQTNVNKLH